LDSFEDARQHEVEECQKNPDKSQQQQYVYQAQYYQQQRTPAHVPGYYNPAAMPPLVAGRQDAVRIIPLMGINESSQMNADDSVACQSLQMFEAGPAEANDAELRTQFPFLTIGLVGLRCIHCSSNPTAVKHATFFPSSIDNMTKGVRAMSDKHLGTCTMAPASVRDINQQAAEKRKAKNREGGSSSHQEEERSRAALKDWCFRLCQRVGVVENGSSATGLCFAQHPIEMYSPGPPPGSGMPNRAGPGTMSTPDPLAPTPVARRRHQMAAAGYDNYAQSGEGYYGGDGMPMHAPMSHSSHDGSQGMMMAGQQQQPGGSPHRGYSSQAGHHEWANTFPFFQDPTGGWACKYCNHIPPHQRDPQSSWSPPNQMPPPPPYMDQHLSMCRGYHQSMSAQQVFQGGPSPPHFHFMRQPYPGGYTPQQQPQQQQGWEAPQGPTSSSQGSQGPSMAYMNSQGNQEMQGAPQARLPSSTAPYQHTHQTPAAKYGDTPSHGMMPQPRASSHRAETADVAVQQAIDYLAASDRDATYVTGGGGASEGPLVLDEDKLLLTDYFFHLMKQLRLCRFSESDRKTRGGKREKIKIGFGGLQCIHCTDANNSRKFFWSNVDRLANSFAEIPGHVLKCRHCPQQTKDALYQLKKMHPEQMARLPRGSQKVFFRRMWRRLHDEDPQGATTPEQPSPAQSGSGDIPSAASDVKSPDEAKTQGSDISPSGTSGSDESVLLMQRSTKEAAKALRDSNSMAFPPSPTSRVLLAIPDDKEWLSDTDCFIRRQIEVFCANSDDVDVARSDRKFPVRDGQVGIRCIHCALSKQGFGARGSGVAYPFSVSGIYESVREFQRLHLDSCENLPVEMKAKLSDLKGSTSLSSVLRKYYVLAAKALGLKDTRDGIRAGADSVPIGSQAAFAFSEGSSVSEEMHKSTVPSFPQSGGVSASPSFTPLENRKRKPEETPDDSSESRKRHHAL